MPDLRYAQRHWRRGSYANTVTGPRLMAANFIELHGGCGQRFAALVAGRAPGTVA